MRCKGFSLFEVMVAVLVLAIGVLGASAVQLAAARTRKDSALMSAAVELAASLAERMRANGAQMRLPDDANPYLHLQFDAAQDDLPAPASCFGGCSPAQQAQADAFETALVVKDGFPSGRVLVCRDPQAGPPAWTCAGIGPIVVKLGWGKTVPRVAIVVPEAW